MRLPGRKGMRNLFVSKGQKPKTTNGNPKMSRRQTEPMLDPSSCSVTPTAPEAQRTQGRRDANSAGLYLD